MYYKLNLGRLSGIVIPLFLFIISFAVYFHSLSPSVYGGDVGDFLSAIAVKGIPHPSGYPLFMILGILFNYLPINQTLAWKVGLISALSSTGAIVLMYLISHLLTKNKIVSVITALTLAFFYTFWLYAELAEVFALNNFFILLLFYLTLLYFYRKKIIYLYLLSFFGGLSLSNHEIMILFLPSFLLLILKTNWKVILEFKIIIKCLSLFLLGLLPYLYIPLTFFYNSSSPINWINSGTWQNFIRFVLRLDYGWHPSSNSDIYLRFLTLKTYSKYILTELTPATIIMIILGMISMLKKKNITLFCSIFLMFFLTGPFAMIYVNSPIFSGFTFGVLERFYMISAITLLIFFPFGVILIVDNICKVLQNLSVNYFRRLFYKTLFNLIFLILPISLFTNNFSKTNLHNVWTGDYLGEDILLSLPKNSVLFISGDIQLFNTLYMQYGRNIRKDIIVINIGTLEKDRNFLIKKEEILRQNKKYSHEELYKKSIALIMKDENIFSNIPLQLSNKKDEKLVWVPYGLILKLKKETDSNLSKIEFLDQEEKIWNKLHSPKLKKDEKLFKKSLTMSQISEIYAQAYVNMADYLVSEYKEEKLSKIYYQRAIEIAPDQPSGYKGIGLYYLAINDCKNAENSFKKIVSLNPEDKTAHIFLYVTYEQCFQNKKKSKQLSDNYYKMFRTSIFSEINKRFKN